MLFPSLAGCIALVTGASSGIGRAIAISLVQNQSTVCAAGRDHARLQSLAEFVLNPSNLVFFRDDLTKEGVVDRLARRLSDDFGRLDILVHSAGVIQRGGMDENPVANLDLQYAINVRVPYVLTRHLLPLLRRAHGQVVFINSSAGLVARTAEVGQYAATKHALKAVADSLREEVNEDGIRVVSAYLGRTATPMQNALHREEHKPYLPERLLQPEDVASVILHTLALPYSAEVTDIAVRPMMRS